jgi:predicted ArsR family transcriptional regulator
MQRSVETSDVALDRDGFLGDMLRELSGSLQDVVGLREAEGYISVVGASIGERIDENYRRALGGGRLDRTQVRDVLVDLKRRIGGQFVVVAETPTEIVLRAIRCPFGDRVQDRPSLCMMTSNVFGFIASANLGYAKIELRETIARGATACSVIVHLEPNDAEGREYFGRDRSPDGG